MLSPFLSITTAPRQVIGQEPRHTTTAEAAAAGSRLRTAL